MVVVVAIVVVVVVAAGVDVDVDVAKPIASEPPISTLLLARVRIRPNQLCTLLNNHLASFASQSHCSSHRDL